jgi:hypothetical protein
MDVAVADTAVTDVDLDIVGAERAEIEGVRFQPLVWTEGSVAVDGHESLQNGIENMGGPENVRQHGPAVSQSNS